MSFASFYLSVAQVLNHEFIQYMDNNDCERINHNEKSEYYGDGFGWCEESMKQ